MLLTVIASLTLSLVPPATAADPPTVRLFAASTQITAERGKNDVVFLDPGIWVASLGGAFELRASRPDYDTPPSLVQTDAVTGSVLRTLPSEMLHGWGGLGEFFHLRVRDRDGKERLFAASPHGIAMFEQRRITTASPTFERMFGYGPGELIGKLFVGAFSLGDDH